MTKITEKDALLRLTSLCARGEHCAHEMREKMRRWELTDDEQARVMEYLTDRKFVDDERYARAFVADKIKYGKWGRRKIEQALWQKRIDDDIRRMVLDEVDDGECIAVLRPLLQSKRKGIKASGDYEMNMKLMRFAIGRGFTMDIIRHCVDCPEE